MTTTNYDSLSGAYARNRRASPGVVDELRSFAGVSRDTRVLEVGCGTANHVFELLNATGCSGWGVEPSEGMRRQAHSHDRLVIAEGSAESVPFEAGFFDLAFSINVIHHVPDIPAHFREVRRILRPRGLVCTLTDSTEMIRNRKPLSAYWPSSAEADIARYPAVESLLACMRQTGFCDIQTREIHVPFMVTDATPYRERAFSCLHMIPDEQWLAGVRHLESDLEKGPVEGIIEYVCLWGRAPDA